MEGNACAGAAKARLLAGVVPRMGGGIMSSDKRRDALRAGDRVYVHNKSETVMDEHGNLYCGPCFDDHRILVDAVQSAPLGTYCAECSPYPLGMNDATVRLR